MKELPWLLTRAGTGTARRMRLYCFSYAGGSGTVFMPWQEMIDPGVEICPIQLPGRAARLAASPCTSMAEAVLAIAQSIQQQDQRPFAFFGHSLGGLLAFEVARFCMRNYLPMPVHLIVSGCGAPQFRSPSRRLHELADAEFIEVLKQFDGTPREVLDNSELMALILPAIRADFGLVADYKYRYAPGLRIPITAFAGRQDAHVSVEQAEGWRRETESSFQLAWFEGGHFFLHSSRDAVVDTVNQVLSPYR